MKKKPYLSMQDFCDEIIKLNGRARNNYYNGDDEGCQYQLEKIIETAKAALEFNKEYGL